MCGVSSVYGNDEKIAVIKGGGCLNMFDSYGSADKPLSQEALFVKLRSVNDKEINDDIASAETWGGWTYCAFMVSTPVLILSVMYSPELFKKHSRDKKAAKTTFAVLGGLYGVGIVSMCFGSAYTSRAVGRYNNIIDDLTLEFSPEPGRHQLEIGYRCRF